ncbi:glycerol-3-phosphate dehydrogenase/oxidase [Desulfatitalea alkaliphila]|uniref:Glycerol-3-phosphate dehydrogenase/oxidase n=1 Tax=Desulfatitalea alkaliphila TaxID=2929485 RepID=A0AA41R7F3_9BACT|nr:glycerol-3-phosphate dehydrogenase/oxidase [Desulfatitalea alkaliphila]MCJ8502346.1 glycerol-3-phosphate dehydrogenase/oxidase [Desulfatitalea alkaliphila]
MPLPKSCDLVIVGGGITGAGIFHETTRLGLKVLLLERHDFAWGTSSRSSKLIHGGLRYLKEGQLRMTRDAVRERERLLQEAPGLVTPVAFIVPVYKDRGPGRWMLEAGLSIYDLMAQKRQHQYLDQAALLERVPFIERRALTGGYAFWDAQVDDARLVLRLIAEGRAAGGLALNYTEVVLVNRDAKGKVAGVTVQDVETRETRPLETAAVINATGCWADGLHPQDHGKRQLRPLRGSHLIFPREALPVQCAVSFMHPADQRAMFVVPWEGVVLVGTTDLDHNDDLDMEPAITPAEADYLIEGVRALFPSLGLSLNRCIASIAGLRPVIGSGGQRAPSEESREHDIWVDNGLVTIAGGKLTTYRRLALDAIKAAQPFLPPIERPAADSPGFTTPAAPPPPPVELAQETWQRLWSRYGHGAIALVENASPDTLQPIPGTGTLWAELPYAAKHEWVRHLEDLLLRRVRIGLLLPDGGRRHIDRIGRLCRPALGWSWRHWRRERRQYLLRRQQIHGFPWRTPPAGRIKTIWRKWVTRLRRNRNPQPAQ